MSKFNCQETKKQHFSEVSIKQSQIMLIIIHIKTEALFTYLPKTGQCSRYTKPICHKLQYRHSKNKSCKNDLKQQVLSVLIHC